MITYVLYGIFFIFGVIVGATWFPKIVNYDPNKHFGD